MQLPKGQSSVTKVVHLTRLGCLILQNRFHSFLNSVLSLGGPLPDVLPFSMK